MKFTSSGVLIFFGLVATQYFTPVLYLSLDDIWCPPGDFYLGVYLCYSGLKSSVVINGTLLVKMLFHTFVSLYIIVYNELSVIVFTIIIRALLWFFTRYILFYVMHFVIYSLNTVCLYVFPPF